MHGMRGSDPEALNRRFAMKARFTEAQNGIIEREGRQLYRKGMDSWMSHSTHLREAGLMVITHPPMVITIPVDESNRVILLPTEGEFAGERMLELPRANLRHGSDPKSAAEHRIAEFGEVAETVPAFFTRPLPSVSTEIHFFYLVKLLRAEAPEKHVQRVPAAALAIQEAISAISTGEIIHGPTVQGLLWYASSVLKTCLKDELRSD
jgi:hypothetical protein